MHNFIYAARRYTDVQRQAVLAEAKRLQKFLQQHLTRMNRLSFFPFIASSRHEISPVHFPTMRDAHDQYHKFFVAQFINDAVVAYPHTP